MYSPFPLPPDPPALAEVVTILDPVLVPLGFAPGQGGASEESAQVIFCRGETDSADGGCVDLVVDLAVDPAGDGPALDDAEPAGWRIVDVRYWGFTSDRWHLEFDAGADLHTQLAGLTRTLPGALR